MNWGRIPESAGLFRHGVFPNAFRGRTFLPEKFWHLVRKDDGVLYGSLAWDRYLPRIEDVHSYGCRLALGMNARKAQTGKIKPKDRRYYCGAYGIRSRSVRALAGTPGLGQVISANVSHLIEAGEIAHVELKISVAIDDPDAEGTKTVIIDRLWNSCTGPLKHICPQDDDVALDAHLSTQLPPAPLGIFVVNTTGLGRLLRFWMCKALTWLWENSSGEETAVYDPRKLSTRMLDQTKRGICRLVWKRVGPTEVYAATRTEQK